MNSKNTEKIDLKDYTATMTADVPSRTCVAMISTECVDEEGEVVKASGVQLNRFVKNPVCFYNHDYSDPVGLAEWIKVTDNGLMASTVFPERPEGHEGEWRPDAVLALVAAGLCRGVSIGFSYLETRPPTAKDKKHFKSTGNELKQVVSKSRLLEYSFAPLPMNEDALVVAARRGFIRGDGSLDNNAIKACSLELMGGVQTRSLRIAPSGSLRLRSIDPAKMTRLEVERLQGRVY